MTVSKFPVNEFQVFSASDLYMDLITEGGMSDLWPQFLWASTNFKWGLFLYPIHFRSVNRHSVWQTTLKAHSHQER